MTHDLAPIGTLAPFWPTGPSPGARDAVFRETPHVVLDDLRTRAPVYQDPALGRIVLTRAADVAAAAADHTLSSDRFQRRPSGLARHSLATGEDVMALLFLDDPDHRQLRGLLTKAFSLRAVEAMRSTVERIAADLLDSVDPAEPFDVMAELATPLPVLVITALLGLDDAHALQVKLWSDAMMAPFVPDRAEEIQRRRAAARDGINDLLSPAIAERRQAPRADMLSDLVAAEHGGARLTDAEILDTCRLLLVAGDVTITDLIGNGIVALLRHPDQFAALRAGAAPIASAIEEILRYDPPIVAIDRQVLADCTIDGCPVEAGQTITAMLLAANHDPALHREPHRFDIGRSRKTHLSFGGGPHACPGAALARLEAEVALHAIIHRFPHVQLAPDRAPQRKAHPVFNGFEAVWVTATPA